MEALAVVLNRPESLSVNRVALTPPGDADVVVDIAFSGISTGTERLLWQGRMPPFPGMGYPLVPGYESVGRIVAAGPACERASRRDGVRSRRQLLRRHPRAVRRGRVPAGGSGRPRHGD